MPDQLPTRPFTALPPPPAGATTAVREGRGLRRRRRLTELGAAAVTLAIAAGVLVAAGGGSPHAADELVPADPPTSSTTPSAGPATTRNGSSLVLPQSGTGSSAGVGAAATGASPQPQRSAPTTGSGQQPPAASGYRTPALIRVYRSAPPPSPPGPQSGPGATLCGNAISNDSEEFGKSTSWCMSAIAAPTSRGHDLRIEVCRDSTGDGTLTFPRRNEVNLVVLRGDTAVWRWSTGHPDDREAHALDVGKDSCWTWTAPWTDVDARGRALPAGDYTLAVSASARELSGFTQKTTTFEVS